MQKNPFLKIGLSSLLATGSTALVCYGVGRFLGYGSFAFAWVLNFMLMAWFTFLVNQMSPNLQAGYFLPKPFEKEGKLYQYAGIHAFRKMLVWIGWEKLMRKEHGLKINATSLRQLEYNTRISETGHLFIFLIVLLVTFLVTMHNTGTLWLWLTNILLNVYPVFLQRFNRPRYLKILQKHNYLEPDRKTQSTKSIATT
ncbi:hypothetical protein ACD591_00860 [Rufibacter glacialis]|uniref:Glycosyl-4,4'-diaponeurosporenoate acyltransferase n=1 Tax=Rufibacter glacialis TaxID=1259555 RepID=A0A5M8QL16_9BACT|nr:hypothetical protein [Rufibacter glacialis]KAA6435456.1 hypothetical protein FOE74_05770 [Rufibacter glacialis]GGK63598.1 hypothetical protein GCM10011405_09550 [Rufibacter glacialis]